MTISDRPTPLCTKFSHALYCESCADAAGMGQTARSPEEAYGDAMDLARKLERCLAEAIDQLERDLFQFGNGSSADKTLTAIRAELEKDNATR